MESNFSSGLKQRRQRESRRGSEGSGARQGHAELRSGHDQYDSTQIRVTVPGAPGQSRSELPFLNVKGKNTQAVQHYDKIMIRDSLINYYIDRRSLRFCRCRVTDLYIFFELFAAVTSLRAIG